MVLVVDTLLPISAYILTYSVLTSLGLFSSWSGSNPYDFMFVQKWLDFNRD